MNASGGRCRRQGSEGSGSAPSGTGEQLGTDRKGRPFTARKKRWDVTRFIIFFLCGAFTGGLLGLRWATQESLHHPKSVIALVFPLALCAVVGGLLVGIFGERFWYWIVGRYEDGSSFLD